MASTSFPPRLASPSTSTQSQAERKASWTPQSRNPVAARLYKVLSTNFDDEDTRQALRTLSDLYATPKGKEVQSVADDIEDEFGHEIPGFSSASSAALVETIPGELAARARKNLRRDMENQLAEGSKKFLEALGEVNSVSFSPVFTNIRVHRSPETTRTAETRRGNESQLRRSRDSIGTH